MNRSKSRTILDFDSEACVAPGQVFQIMARPQIPLELGFLRCDVEIARRFTFDDVMIGMRSQFPCAQNVRAMRALTKYVYGIEIVAEALPGHNVYLIATNTSDEEYVFRAQWEGVPLPGKFPPMRSFYEWDGPVSKISDIPGVRRGLANGFGWDPDA